MKQITCKPAMWLLLPLAIMLLIACMPVESLGSQPDLVAPGSIADLDSDVAAALNQQQLLARQLGLDPQDVEIANVEQVMWSDSCLGAGTLWESCLRADTPGYKVTLSVDGEEYLYHTDRDGYRSRLVAAPELEITDAILEWSGPVDNGECVEALINAETVGFGLCGGSPKIGGHFVADARPAVLMQWAATFASFDAETEFGSVRFVGSGSDAATPEEQQMMARWARTVAMEAAAGESLAGMSYHGPAEMGSPDASKCAMLQLGTSIEAGIGSCDGTMINKEMGKRTYLEWEYLRNHFAPFVIETETEKVAFEGMGSVDDAHWQRAIVAWARARYAELSTERTSATISTALSWHLGQDHSQKNVCMHLTVLDYGYAYAEEIACSGSEVLKVTGSWLTSEELAQLDQWLYQRAPLYDDENYVDGKGEQEMSEAEKAEVNVWAMELWSRIRRESGSVEGDSGAGHCTEAAEEMVSYRNDHHGYCLLLPATYTIFDTNPNEIAIVKESLLNVTDPRLHIAVIAAEGKDAEQFADQIVAAMTGFDIERSSQMIAGQEAVVLDNVPGQDINRRVLIVYGDLLYDLTYTPMSSPEIEAFYADTIANFELFETQE